MSRRAVSTMYYHATRPCMRSAVRCFAVDDGWGRPSGFAGGRLDNRDGYPTRAAAGALFLVILIASIGSQAFAADPPDAKCGGDRTKTRDEILNSDAWRKTLAGLDEWFSIQTIYDRAGIEKAKKRLAERVQSMSAADLEEFAGDLDAKLAMVLGPEGRDILGWVSANLAAAAPAYRKQLDLQSPDILKMTAAQLREAFDLLERKREAARHQTAALNQARQARIAALQTKQRQQESEREQALSRGVASYGHAGYRSPYHPHGMRKYPNVVSRQSYFWGFGIW